MTTSVVLVLVVVVVVVVATLGGTALASQCACATANVHVRSRAGFGHSVLGTLRTNQCLPLDGQSLVAGSYTWLRVDYHGQSAWAASDWLTLQNCTSNNLHVQLPGCPRIVTRAEWGARAPAQAIGDMPGVPVYVFIHHGASSPCFDRGSCERKVRGYQNYHMDFHRWWDIGYNFVVGEDGNAYEARGWTKIGAHTKGYNSVGIAICVIGDFSHHVPNQTALDTVRQLIECGLHNRRIISAYTLKGHRDVGNTTCPGDSFYNLIQQWPHFVAGSSSYSQSGGSVVG